MSSAASGVDVSEGEKAPPPYRPAEWACSRRRRRPARLRADWAESERCSGRPSAVLNGESLAGGAPALVAPGAVASPPMVKLASDEAAPRMGGGASVLPSNSRGGKRVDAGRATATVDSGGRAASARAEATAAAATCATARAVGEVERDG
eukprot:scaffold55710_cov25-Tisochrysis_lutea.AAC.5